MKRKPRSFFLRGILNNKYLQGYKNIGVHTTLSIVNLELESVLFMKLIETRHAIENYIRNE